MSDNGSTASPTVAQHQEITITVRAIFTFLLIIVNLLTLTENVVFWVAILRTKHLRIGSNILLLSLSFTDLLVGLTSMPLTIYNVIHGRMQVTREVCNVAGYFFLMCEVATVLSLMAITVNRYIRICHTGQYHKCCGRPGVFGTIAGVWAIAALTGMPLFPGYSKVPYSPEQMYCVANKTDPRQIYFLKLTVGYCIPLTTIATCYGLIFKHFKDSKNKLRAAIEGQSCITGNKNTLKERLNRASRKMSMKRFFRRISDINSKSSSEQSKDSIGSKGTPEAETMNLALAYTADSSLPTVTCNLHCEGEQPACVFEPSTVAQCPSHSGVPLCKRHSQCVPFEDSEIPADNEDSSATDSPELPEDEPQEGHLSLETQETIEKSPTTYSFLGSTLARYFICRLSNPESMPVKLCLPVASVKKIRWREEEMRVSTSIALIIAACIFSYAPALSISTAKQYGVPVPIELGLIAVVLLYANSFFNPIIYGARNQAVREAYETLWRDVKKACRRSSPR